MIFHSGRVDPGDGGDAEGASEHVRGLEQEVARLSRAVVELSTLNDLASAIGSSLDMSQIMRTIVQRSIRAVSAEEGVITLSGEEADASPRTLVREIRSSVDVEAFHFRNALLGWMQLNRSPLLVNDPASDGRFRGVEWEEGIRSLVSVPLTVKGRLTGALTVYNKKDGRPFDAADQRLLSIIASQSAQVIENARLVEQELKLTRMREQVALAAEVQRHLLPDPIPEVQGFEIHGANVTAEMVGGDYFDVVPVDDRRWLVCIGDVSGKGLPASLLMANVQAMIRLTAAMRLPTDEAMRQANTLLCRSTPDSKFVTFFVSMIDSVSGEVEYCNAGHNPPLFVTAGGSCDRFLTSGAVLGMLESIPYTRATRAMQPGDTLFLFSDGVTEALSETDEEFGEDRTLELVLANRHRPARELVQIVLDAISRHASGRSQSDDITIVVVKRKAGRPQD